MTNREEFDVWWGGNSISINNEYEKDTAFEAWEARGKLEQPTTQEPVAWMNDIAFSMEKDELTADKFGDIVPLYTHPKQWQGLSDEEIWDIANFLGKNKEWDYPVMFAKTIEMALKEKNT